MKNSFFLLLCFLQTTAFTQVKNKTATPQKNVAQQKTLQPKKEKAKIVRYNDVLNLLKEEGYSVQVANENKLLKQGESYSSSSWSFDEKEEFVVWVFSEDANVLSLYASLQGENFNETISSANTPNKSFIAYKYKVGSTTGFTLQIKNTESLTPTTASKIYVLVAKRVVYDRISDYSEGFACVTLHEQKGFINKKGKEVVPLKYDNTNYFSEGLAAVRKDYSKWGFVDTVGNEVIPFIYDDANSFYDGMAAVNRNKKIGFIDKTGSQIIPFKYDETKSFKNGLAAVKLNDKWGFIDKSGNEVIAIKYDDVKPFEGGLADVQLKDKRFCIDKTGAFRYDWAWVNKNGFRKVYLNEKAGAVNDKGNEIIPAIYDYIDDFEGGITRVRLNTKWGVLDTTGKEIIPLMYDDISSFDQGVAIVKLNGKKGIFNTNGKEMATIKYDEIWGFNEGLAVASINGKYGFINRFRSEVIQIKYNKVNKFTEGLAAVKLSDEMGGWGYIDTTGKEIIPLKYDYAKPFSNGLAAIQWGSSYGYVNKIGEVVIRPQFSSAYEFDNWGHAKVYDFNNKEITIDKRGEEINKKPSIECGNCKGDGFYRCTICTNGKVLKNGGGIENCNVCNGKAVVKCYSCNGTGKIKQN